MNLAILTTRIRETIAAGELKLVPEAAAFKPVNSLIDLLSDWQELFPGIEADEEGGTVSLFGFGVGLRRPAFTPQPRRSCRPLPAPLPIIPMPQPPCKPGLFLSVQAIWSWYEQQGLADTNLIDRPFSNEDLSTFIDPLLNRVEGYYPLGTALENLEWDCSVSEIIGLYLWLPFYNYEEDGVDVVEAFLSGPESVASLLTYQHQNSKLSLSAQDERLIKKEGFDKLTENFARYPGKKSCDLLALENWFETWFSEVHRLYPDHKADHFAIISGNGGQENELVIRTSADIDFALAYSAAYYNLMNQFPPPYDFSENDGGCVANFIHEICEAWRKTPTNKRHKPVPEIPTLAERIQRGEL